jgi:hypothetical protein
MISNIYELKSDYLKRGNRSRGEAPLVLVIFYLSSIFYKYLFYIIYLPSLRINKLYLHFSNFKGLLLNEITLQTSLIIFKVK